MSTYTCIGGVPTVGISITGIAGTGSYPVGAIFVSFSGMICCMMMRAVRDGDELVLVP